MNESKYSPSRSWLLIPAAALASGVLFAVPALFPSLYILGWVAFVPLLVGLQYCRSSWQAYGFGLLTGYLAWAFFSHAIAEFVQLFKGYSLPHSIGLASLYWFYCAQSFAIVAVLTHFARRANAVLWVFPTVLTLVLALYPAIFPWQMGNSQSGFLVAIQATDIAGVSGLDFVIGIVNVLIAQAIVGRPVFLDAVPWPHTGWFLSGSFTVCLVCPTGTGLAQVKKCLLSALFSLTSHRPLPVRALDPGIA